MRLDLYLVENKKISRSKAAALIREQSVFVNGKCIDKCSYMVKDSDLIRIADHPLSAYVSRGALKLKKAIDVFQLDFSSKVICDIGSSTGGFTDCALQHHARHVYAIDVGSHQLHESLQNDPRITLYENLNFKDVTTDLFDEPIDFFVCDVSFISIRKILDKLQVLFPDFSIVLLFKPQFEVGPSRINKNGVVKKKSDLVDALISFQNYLNQCRIAVNHCTYSPIVGQKEGNIEFLFYLSKEGKQNYFDYNKLVEDAIKNLR